MILQNASYRVMMLLACAQSLPLNRILIAGIETHFSVPEFERLYKVFYITMAASVSVLSPVGFVDPCLSQLYSLNIYLRVAIAAVEHHDQKTIWGGKG